MISAAPRRCATAALARCAIAGCILAMVTLIFLPGPAAACLNDSDCDDGLFCTTDHCILFVCAHFDRDCNDFNQCTDDRCDEQQNQCLHGERHLASCEDFNIFTTDEVCCGTTCEGLTKSITGHRCCVSTDCAGNEFCVDGGCVAQPTPQPTATVTRTPTRTPTRTRTSTPDPRPALTMQDVSTSEGNSGTHPLVLSAMLSRPLPQAIGFHFATMDGSAVAGSDYIARSGDVTVPANTTVIPLPPITVIGDTAVEPDETFFIVITQVSSAVRVADPVGTGGIMNDDPVPGGVPGIGALAPHDGVTTVDADTPVTLTWTHPVRWRDLSTLDLRLRSAGGVALWVRFDEAANTIALVHPADVSLGPAFAPGAAAELDGDAVTLEVEQSRVNASGPEAPTVDIDLVLRFQPAAAGTTYVVDAAATTDAGDVQDFDTIGTISVVPIVSCPGDCTGDGAVTVAELVAAVNITLGAADITSCSAADSDENGAVDVHELVGAVNAALAGCTAP